MKTLEHIMAGGGHNSGPQIVMGTIGWEGEAEYCFFGDDHDDGHTLVRVQLYDGRDITKPLNPKRAQGHKILCHLSSTVLRVPKPDTRVFVAIAQGMEHVTAAGVIFATVEKSNNTTLGIDRAVLDYGDDVHVVIKGKSVSIQSSENEFISVGTPKAGGKSGLTFQAKDGSGGVIQEGVVAWFVADGGETQTMFQMDVTSVACFKNDGGYWTCGPNAFLCYGPQCNITGGTVFIGPIPTNTPASAALYGVTGIAGVASTSVFISA